MDRVVFNLFNYSVVDILNRVGKVTANKIEQKEIARTFDIERGLSLIIGIVGRLKGLSILSIDEDLFRKITDNMFNSSRLASSNEIRTSAISELFATAISHWTVAMYQNAYVMAITPPVIMKGKRINFHVDGDWIYQFTYTIEKAKMDVYLALKEERDYIPPKTL